MPKFGTRRSRKAGVTTTDAMAAFAILGIEELREELEAERIIRRAVDGIISNDLLDEIADLREQVESYLPTQDPERELPPEAAEIVYGLSDEEIDRATIAAALELELPVSFVYTNGDGETKTRHVSPYELKTTLDGRRFVLGWDHDRQGIRQFEIGRAETRVTATDSVSYRQPELV